MPKNGDESGSVAQAVEAVQDVNGSETDEENMAPQMDPQTAALSEVVQELRLVNVNLKGLEGTLQLLRQDIQDA